MTAEPLLSVLMTTYNRAQYVEASIASVLKSTYTNWELIIVDDCSIDNTSELVEQYLHDKRIRFFNNEKNLGDYPNRNKAASLAKGKYIKYLDSDDLIYPYGLEVMVTAMEACPEAGIGLTYNSYDNHEPFPICFRNEQTFLIHFFKKSILFIGPSGCIYNRAYFEELGGFNTEFKVASDYDFNMRAALHKPIVLFQRDLFWWREHEGQEFVNSSKNNEYIIFNYLINKQTVENSSLNKTLKLIILKNNEILMGRRLLKLVPKTPLTEFLRILKLTKYPKIYFLRCVLPAIKLSPAVILFFISCYIF